MKPTDLLAVESQPWRTAGAKERAITEQLNLSPVRYYQLLLAALDDPHAVAAHPVTAARLRRLSRSKVRSHARWQQMGHVGDRWTRPGPNGRRIKSDRHGRGKRWQAVSGQPDGRRKKALTTRDGALAHLREMELHLAEGTETTGETSPSRRSPADAFSSKFICAHRPGPR